MGQLQLANGEAIDPINQYTLEDIQNLQFKVAPEQDGYLLFNLVVTDSEGASISEALTITVANAFDSPLRIGGTQIKALIDEDSDRTSLGLNNLQYVSAKKVGPEGE